MRKRLDLNEQPYKYLLMFDENYFVKNNLE